MNGSTMFGAVYMEDVLSDYKKSAKIINTSVVQCSPERIRKTKEKKSRQSSSKSPTH